MKSSKSPEKLQSNGDFRCYGTDSTIASATYEDSVVSLAWDDGAHSEFDATWLQDNCSCSLCVHLTTLEPLVHFTDKDFSGIEGVNSDKLGLHVGWKNGHVSFYGNGWLRSHTVGLNQKHSEQFDQSYQLWDSSSLQLPEFQFLDLDEPSNMYTALKKLQSLGLIIIKNAPRRDKLVVDFAKRIGELRSTAFGDYFDVSAQPDPNSNGYTSLELHPHIDLAYYESPPTFQLLHFIDNEAKGGFSTLVDGFKLSKIIEAEQPEVFELLTKPIYTFRFQDHKTEHSYRGPIIELDAFKNARRIRMDFDTIEPLIGSIDEVKNARHAIKSFFDYTVDGRFQYTHKMDAGDLLMITNTRLLHGRTAFDANTGKRRLQVCYLDRGDVVSCMQVLKRTMEGADGLVYDDAGHFLLNTLT